MDPSKGFTFLAPGNTPIRVLETISAEKALDAFCKNSSEVNFLDVRSEDEFEKGKIPFSQNVPILKNDHRHKVGLTYKKSGQEAAVHLGHQLVDPLRDSLVKSWSQVLNQSSLPLLFCWRGGLRSQLTQQWLAEAQVDSLRVEGGYKALRSRLLLELEALPPLLILSGPTGSHKTRLLLELPSRATIDLEGLACHRGSAFGLELGRVQPSQSTFENSLLADLHCRKGELLLEDESFLIGRRSLPKVLYAKMSESNRVLISTSLSQRAQNIVGDYIQAPLEKDPQTAGPLKAYFLGALFKIRSRLGGVLHSDLESKITLAFEPAEFDFQAHENWVSLLLENYYDKAYDYALKKHDCKVQFSGSYGDCKNWLESRYQ